MPSRPGMTMSVRRSSNLSSASAASAAEPSATARTSWPRWPSARVTNALTALSSSASRIFAMALLFRAERDEDDLRRLAGLGDAGAEGNAGAGEEPLVRHREGPRGEIVLVGIAQHHRELRHLLRHLGDVHHLALDDERRQPVLDVVAGGELLQVERAWQLRHGDAEHLIIAGALR